MSGSAGSKVGSKLLEVRLQTHLIYGEVGGAQEAVFEVVKVEHGGLGIETFRWQQAVVLKSCGTLHLDVWQQAYGLQQQLLFLLAVALFRLPSVGQGIVEGKASKVGLQVARFIVTDSKYLRNRESGSKEMPCQINERTVFLHGSANDTDDTPRLEALGRCQTHILPVTAGLGQCLCLEGWTAIGGFIERDELLHDFFGFPERSIFVPVQRSTSCADGRTSRQ